MSKALTAKSWATPLDEWSPVDKSVNLFPVLLTTREAAEPDKHGGLTVFWTAAWNHLCPLRWLGLHLSYRLSTDLTPETAL